MELPSRLAVHPGAMFACPYCDALVNDGAISCRCCGRDLTPILPLLRRLHALEARLAAMEMREETRLLAPPPAMDVLATAEGTGSTEADDIVAPAAQPVAPRRFWALALGFVVLIAAYWTVVIWLDLSLAVLRLASIAIPLAVGVYYFGARPRPTWFDTGVAIVFAVVAVGTMNALLGWVDSIPMVPQGTAAWRESFFYALSIGASLFCGMLLRVTQVALSARGLTSLPRLRDSVMAVNGKVPMDTLKAIELTILLVSTVVTAITGLVAGFLGVTR